MTTYLILGKSYLSLEEKSLLKLHKNELSCTDTSLPSTLYGLRFRELSQVIKKLNMMETNLTKKATKKSLRFS